MDNIYFAYFFLNDLHIINQQGDLNINTKKDKQIADILINTYSTNPINSNNIFDGLLRLIDTYASQYFPKSINIELKKSNFPKNNLNFNFSTNTKILQSLYTQIRLISSIIPSNNTNPLKEHIKNIEKENRQKDNIILQNKIILDSKYQLFYPIYIKIKNLFTNSK
jgi:hypothetical protein